MYLELIEVKRAQHIRRTFQHLTHLLYEDIDINSKFVDFHLLINDSSRSAGRTG